MPPKLPGFYYDAEKKRYFRCVEQHNIASLPAHVTKAMQQAQRASSGNSRSQGKSQPDVKRPCYAGVNGILYHRQLGRMDPETQHSALTKVMCRKLRGSGAVGPPLPAHWNPHDIRVHTSSILNCESVDFDASYTFVSMHSTPIVVHGTGPHALYRPIQTPLPDDAVASLLEWRPRPADKSCDYGEFCLVATDSSSRTTVPTYRIIRTTPASTITSTSGPLPSEVVATCTLDRFHHTNLVAVAFDPCNEDIIFVGLTRRIERAVLGQSRHAPVHRMRDRLTRLQHLRGPDLLCAATAEGRLHIIDTRQRSGCAVNVKRSSGKPLYIQQFQQLANDRQLMVASYGHRLELWDYRGAAGHVVHEYDGYVNDGRVNVNMAVHGGGVVAASCTDNSVRLWDVNNPAAPLNTISIPGEKARDVCFPRWHPMNSHTPLSFLSLHSKDTRFEWFHP